MNSRERTGGGMQFLQDIADLKAEVLGLKAAAKPARVYKVPLTMGADTVDVSERDALLLLAAALVSFEGDEPTVNLSSGPIKLLAGDVVMIAREIVRQAAA